MSCEYNCPGIVIFGAGKIGRSFIGQLFARGGYEVVFVEKNRRLTDELNSRRNYNVIIKGEEEELINIRNVRAVNTDDVEKVALEIVNASIIAFSVGIDGLLLSLDLLSEGLKKRYQADPDSRIDIIIAENLRNSSQFVRKGLADRLPDWYPLDRLVGTVETSIGKMVPIMLKKDEEEDILQVFAESYNTLILDKKGFVNPVPGIEGIAPKENIKAWVDRKLFIHNLGHATSAYIGFLYNPEYKYIYEVLGVNKIFEFIRGTMLQAADILRSEYPGDFSVSDLTDHIDDLLFRFRNRALGDTVYRVGSDLKRKLGREDRLAGCIIMARNRGKPFDKILKVLVCACRFMAGNEEGKYFPGDLEFKTIYNRGIEHVLKDVCRFDPHTEMDLFAEAVKLDKELTTNGFSLKYLGYS